MKEFALLLFFIAASLQGVDAQITPQVVSTANNQQPDAKYFAPLPKDENGKVYLQREVQLSAGTDQEKAFQKLQTWTDRCMLDSRIIKVTDIPSDQPQTIQRQVCQTIVFSSSLLALDKTEMDYLLTISLQGDKIKLTISHIHYRYNGENRDRMMLRYSAEDHIADEVALNKKRTKFVHGYKKFRVSTIDLIDEFESSLKFSFLAE